MAKGEWLTLSAAAALLGVHASTLRLWADHGEVASTRTAGGHRRFRHDDIEAFAAARREVRPTGVSTSQTIAGSCPRRATQK